MARFGKYDLVRKLATGGMAEVFLARFEWALGLEKMVVVKRILPHLAEDPAFCDMFFSEAKLASQLNHPGIAQIIEFGEHEGTYFLSMEYVDGPSLRTLEYRAAQREETIPFAHSARIAASCCEALAYAHDLVDARTDEPLHLVHRDVSPDNILIARTGAVKLVDFGIAKAATQSHRTETGGVKGKLGYMSPEQLRARPVDRRTDVYALGVVLYEMLSGTRPYDAPTEASLLTAILTEDIVPLRTRSPGVPQVLERIVLRALQRMPEDRYPDCRAMHADLEEALFTLRQSATVFQIALLAAQNSETDRWMDSHPARALVTPERPHQTVQTPLPWRSEGTDAGRQAAPLAVPQEELLAEPLALTGTEDTYKRPQAQPPAFLGSLDEAGARDPTFRRASPSEKTRSFGTGTTGAPDRRPRRLAIPAALASAAVLAGFATAALLRAAPAATSETRPPPAPEPVAVAQSDVPPLPAPEELATPPVPSSPSPRRAPAKPAQPMVELVLSSSPPSQLRILAGRKVLSEGRSPIAARVPPGTVTVEASANGETPWFKQETLTLDAASRQISHTITIEQGSLLVRTVPASHVTVDGVPRGDVPLKLTLFQGPHAVRLECDRSIPLCADQPVLIKSITVEPGKSLEIMQKWQ